eukprot:3832018-Pleurochrysis_carterae.AAC.1
MAGRRGSSERCGSSEVCGSSMARRALMMRGAGFRHSWMNEAVPVAAAVAVVTDVTMVAALAPCSKKMLNIALQIQASSAKRLRLRDGRRTMCPELQPRRDVPDRGHLRSRTLSPPQIRMRKGASR